MPHSNMLCYEFGPFKLNADHRTLTRDGSPVSLRAKAADVLLVLVKNAGELVDKDALMAQVWPDYDRYQKSTGREIPVVVLERAT